MTPADGKDILDVAFDEGLGRQTASRKLFHVQTSLTQSSIN